MSKAYRWWGLLVLLLAGVVWAQRTGESVIVREALQGDQYFAGERVDVLAEVGGDVVAAGRTVTLGALVQGDAIVAGGELRVAGPVTDDLRAAGWEVRVDAPISGHAVLAGRDVALGREAAVGDWLWAAGETVTVLGRVTGPVRIAAQHAVIGGRIDGNVEVAAERVELRPGARISGDLLVRSGAEPQVPPGASIGGELILRPPPEGMTAEREPDWDVGGWLFGLVVALVTALGLYLLLPRVMEAANGQIGGRPWWHSLGLGLAVLAATPVVVFVLLVTGVGALLGLALIALYLLALLAGWVAGSFWLGQWGWRRLRQRVAESRLRAAGALAAAVAVLALIGLVPVLGGLAQFAVLLFGLGGLMLAAWHGRGHWQPAGGAG